MKTKKVILLFSFMLFLNVSAIKAQVIKIENGISFSSMTNQEELYLGYYDFNKKIIPYHISVGVDYFIHKGYKLSSNIGYLVKGGKTASEEIPIITDEGISSYLLIKNHSLWFKYLTLDTTFDLTYSIHDRINFYIGAGPRLDIRTATTFKMTYLDLDGNEIKNSSTTNQTDSRNLIWGAKCNAGFTIPIKNFELGANFSYLPSFNTLYKNSKEKENTFTLGLTLGYRIF